MLSLFVMKALHLVKDKFLASFNSTLGYWLLIAATFIFSRLATWVYPYDSDHWIFYYVGHDWFHGGSLYVTAWDHKPPVIFFINGLLSFLGSNIIVHRTIFTLVAVLSAFIFYRLSQTVFTELLPKKQIMASKVSLLVFVLWSNLQQFTSSANNNENFGMVFFLAMMLAYLAYRKERRWQQLLVSGICFSVLFFMKGNFLLLGVPVGIFMIVDYWKSIPKLIGQSLIFISPLFLQASAWIIYFATNGTLNEFIFASFTFSAKYSTSAWKGDLSNLKLFYLLVLIASPLLIVQPLAYLLRAKDQLKNQIYWYFLLTIAFGSIAFFAVGVPYLYYFQILMPVYAIIATFVFYSKNEMKRSLWITVATLLILGTLANLGYSNIQIARWYLGRTETEAREYREIADYVKHNSVESDKVFAYDYGAAFYRLSERGSGSRFISASVLLLDYRDKYGFDLDDKFISEMDASRTKYVVVYRDREQLYYQNIPIVEYFDRNYHVEKEFDKYKVLRRN